MINHLRTLLRNIDGTYLPKIDYPGEEFVPPEFRTIRLPGPILGLRRILFGPNPDLAFINFRLRQFLTIIHSTEFAEYAYASDPRVTYWPFAKSFFNTLLPIATIEAIGTANVPSLLGVNKTLGGQGRLKYQWRVTIVDSSSVLIESYDDLDKVISAVVVEYEFTNNLSSIVSLPSSTLSMRFPPSPGAVWIINALGIPSKSLAELIEDLECSFGVSLLHSLFGTSPPEPFRTFRNLWESHEQLLYRLVGVVLALGYRTDQFREV